MTVNQATHSVGMMCRLLGVSRAALYNVLDEKAAVTPDMALRLGRLFGRELSNFLLHGIIIGTVTLAAGSVMLILKHSL